MHVHQVLAPGVRVVGAERDGGRVVVERAEAELHLRARRDRALRLPVDGRAAVVAEAVPPDVAVVPGRVRCVHVRTAERGDQSRQQQSEKSDLTH